MKNSGCHGDQSKKLLKIFSSQTTKPEKNIAVFQVTRPTLRNGRRPKNFLIDIYFRVSDHLEMFVNRIDLRKIMYRFMSQNVRGASTNFVEFIHSRYFHKHVDHISVETLEN